MRVDIVTLFPDTAMAPLSQSIMGRARRDGLVEIEAHDLRKHGLGRHLSVDDTPYGGGAGMVMRCEPFYAAVAGLRRPESRVLLMTPQGRRFDQSVAARLSREAHLIILCAHYEGVDHRVVEGLVDEEVSLGDYVLTNGAIAAAVVCDAVVRLLPGVLGDETSAIHESFQDGVLEGPQYTRPAEFQGMKVPEVLQNGNHAEIDAWRKKEGLRRTRENRPDLLSGSGD